MTVRSVDLESVDRNDETFRISEDWKIAAMIPSLGKIGQVNPVILIEKEEGPSAIVCGFRRVHALAQLGERRILARFLAPEESRPEQAFSIAIWDNLSHRKLEALEKARVLDTLDRACGIDREVIVRTWLPALGLSPHKNVLGTYLTLHRLGPELRRKLGEGRVTVATAVRLAGASEDFRTVFVSLLESVRWSASLQRETLDLVEDLAHMTGTAPAGILEDPEIWSAAGDVRLSDFQRGVRIHEILYRRRNPRLTAARDRFAAGKAKLGLPGTIRISPDPFFETPRLRVEFEVDSAEDFRQAVRSLSEAARSTALETLLKDRFD